MLKKAYLFFLVISVLLLVISIIVKVLAENTFDLIVFGIPIANTYSFLWLMFGLYTFILAGIYAFAERIKLRLRAWMVVSHIIAIVLFLFFFGALNIFNAPGFRSFIEQYDVPLLTLFGIYMLLVAADVVLFITGIVFLLVNVLFLSKRKSENNKLKQ